MLFQLDVDEVFLLNLHLLLR